MKHIISAIPMRNYFSGLVATVLMMCPSFHVDAQADNTLTVEPIVGRVDRTVYVPVYLTNDDQAVAAQFDITLPFSMPTTSSILMSNRADNHSVSARQNGKTVTVIVSSMTNKSLKGNSGILLRIPMSPYDDGQTAAPYAITLSNIVITDSKGNNIATASTGSGTFTVSTDDLPDLVVTDISAASQTLDPGTTTDIYYTVCNSGDAVTQAGWTAMIYMESSTTGERVYLTSQSSNQILAAGAQASMVTSVNLPFAMRMDGDCKVYVDVVPASGCGELIVDQANNNGYSSDLTLTKQLLFRANRTEVTEGERYPANIYLTRSGDCSTDETFTINSSVSNLFQLSSHYYNGYNYAILPATVVIPAGSSSVTLSLASVNDDIVRAREADVTVESAHGYAQKSIHFLRNDNDRNPLSLSFSAQSVTEGKSVMLTATRGGELTDELSLPLTFNYPNRFASIPVITFAKGQSTATVELLPTDDTMPQLDQTITVSTSAQDYRMASASFLLLDNDRPTLTLEILPATVSETAGNSAAFATIHRAGGTTDAVTVRLRSSSSDVFTGSTIVEIPAGASSATVPIGVTDNSIVDGTRTATLSAAMYFKSQSLYAPSDDRAYSSAQLTVTDNESPYLTLSSNVKCVAEGSSATITVTRTVVSYSSSQTVSLTCNDPSVNIPETVTIPSGMSYYKFSVSVSRNQTADDDRMFTIVANANGLEQAYLSMQITDRTLPDAVVTDVATTDELFSGVEAEFVATVHNYGTAVLQRGMTIDFYLCTSSKLSRYSSSLHVLQATLPQDIEIGEEMKFAFTAKVPETTGTHWLYAHVNKDGAVKEFSTSNNISSTFRQVYIAAPFSVVKISTDKQDYVPGEYVRVTGRMEGRLNGQTVRVRLNPVNADRYGQHSYTDCKIDSAGGFSAAVLVDRSAYGMMRVDATALGQTEPAKYVTVNVYNMALSASETRLTCDQTYQKQGTLRIYNKSGKAITGLQLTTSTLPYGCGLTFGSLPQSIAAGGYADVQFTVNPAVASTSADYQTFSVQVKCQENVSSQIQFRYLCRAINSYLSFSPSPLNTTLLLNSARTVEVQLTNYGLKETGSIVLNMPSDIKWLSSLAPATLPSLSPGQSTTIRFQLTHQQGMHSGQTFSAQIIANPENGPARALNIKTTVVGTEYSTLSIDIDDVYSLASNDHSHVSGAVVTVQNPRNGQIYFTGLTDGAGHWQTSDITQGTYKVSISALRHKSVVKTVTLGPGDDQTLSCILPYQAVQADFVTSQSLEDNSYIMQMNIDIDSLAPQAIVVPTLTEEGFNQSPDTLSILLRNVGSREAIYPRLLFPTDIDGVSFRVLNGYPASLNPGENYLLSVRFECPDNMRRRVIASLLLNYGFSIASHNLSESDIYQQLTGYVAQDDDPDEPATAILPPDMPSNPVYQDDPDDGYFGDEQPTNDAVANGGSPDAALPTPGCSFALTFDDVESIYSGQSVGAKLTVNNTSDSGMTNIQFIPTVYDYDTDDYLTDLMPCTELSDAMTGFQVTSSQGYNLAANTEGLLPLNFLADEQLTADGSRKLRIGGQLSYLWGGIMNTAVLPNMVVTVSPVGKVQLVYLVQQDYLGDNPLTDQVSESVSPAEVVVLVRNTGATDITGLQVNNDKLEVLSNSDFSSVAVNGLYAALDGQQGNYDFLAINADSIQKDAVRTARFMYSSPTMAHVHALDSIGNHADVSADSNIKAETAGTYTLFRSVRRNHDQALSDELSQADIDYSVAALAQGDCFLVSTLPGAVRQPNAIMTADGDVPEDVMTVSDAAQVSGSSGSYQLSVTADAAGWIYGEIHDPTNGLMQLTTVTRNSDNAVISAANFWQTDRTVQDDYSLINENMLHFVDYTSSASESYTLTFTAREGSRMKVLAIHLLTDSNDEVANGAATADPVTKIRIEFTKECRNVYKQYVTLTAHGEALDLGDNFITRNAYTDYTVSLKNAPLVPGLHKFTIITSSLKQRQPALTGEGTDSVLWTELTGMKAHVDISVGPDGEDGTTDLSTGDYDYGSLTVNATASPGYNFAYWTLNGRRQSTPSPSITLSVTGDMALRANFVAKAYTLTLLQPENGQITGAVDGIYPADKTLTITAVAATGYIFAGWLVNGTTIDSHSPTISINLTDDTQISALFQVDEQTLNYTVTQQNQYGTLVLPFTHLIPQGIKAYRYDSYDKSSHKLRFVEDDILHAYTPYIIYAPDGAELSLTGVVDRINYTDIAGTELFLGAIEPQVRTEGYILQNQAGTPKFYNLNGRQFSIPAGRCWLDLSDAGVKSLAVSLQDAPTIIEAQSNPSPSSATIHDLQGRQIQTMEKGRIYIIGTKKHFYNK